MSQQHRVPAVPSATTGSRGGRPMIMATRGVVSSGHYLATGIGLDVLKRGGNAMDAAAAVGFALTVLKPHQNGIGGEAPILVWSADERRVWAVSGHGVAPREATLERFQQEGLDIIPGDGFLPAVVPPAVASWILLLERFGTMRLADVLTPTLQLAQHGFPMYDALRNSIAGAAQRFRTEWPSSAATFMPAGRPPPLGTVWRQPDWAATFKQLIDAEARCAKRADGLRAAGDVFYRGPVAETIVAFARDNPVRDASGRAHAGLLSMADFDEFQARVEDPVCTSYRGIDIFKCSSWTQGLVLLQTLNLLEGYDLAAMGHNTADTVHTVVECMKLAYADREFYYGDPAFVDMPLERLLSKPYAADRRKLVDPAVASRVLRPDGFPELEATSVDDVNTTFERRGNSWRAGGVSLPAGRHTDVCRSPEEQGGHPEGDTTKLEVIDAAGNMVSATPSGGWLMSSPVVPGLGFPLGTRGQMFSLVAGHPNCLEPGKRPRTSLTPSLATKDGQPLMVFGSPGGDQQDQWALQFLVSVVDFGMSLQQAVEAPTFWTRHFPSSFYPRQAEPGSLDVEARIDDSVRAELAERGHTVHVAGDWAGGNTLAAAIDPATGVRHAAASPRLDPAYAAGY